MGPDTPIAGPPGTEPSTPSPASQPQPESELRPESELQKSVNINFTANRDQLYTAWPALANLPDMAGTITITDHASSEEGFDGSKLRNGVIEPLQEENLIK